MVFSFSDEALSARGDSFKVDDPITFGVEKISIFRSHDVKPERAMPVIYGDLIFAASSRKKIAAFDFSGNRAFTLELDFAPVSTPAIGHGRLFAGGDDGYFHCVEAATGAPVWSVNFMSIDFSRPAITQDLVIFQTGRDRVVALSSDDGKWLWEYQHLPILLKNRCKQCRYQFAARSLRLGAFVRR